MQMEEKILDLIEKVYIELQGTKKELQDTKKELSERIDGVESSLSNRLSKVEMKLEHDVSNKIQMLFEAQEATNERLDRIEKKVDDIAEKVDRHDIKIQVIEGGKSKKSV